MSHLTTWWEIQVKVHLYLRKEATSPCNNSWRPFAPFNKQWWRPRSTRTGFWLRFRSNRQPVKTDSRSIWMRYEQTTKNCAGSMRNCAENCNAWGSAQQASKARPFQLGLVPCHSPKWSWMSWYPQISWLQKSSSRESKTRRPTLRPSTLRWWSWEGPTLCTANYSWEHSWAQHWIDSLVSLMTHHFIWLVLNIVQGTDHCQPSPLYRPLWCEAILGRAPERLSESIRDTSGKVAHQRRSHDGARLQAGNAIRTLQRFSNKVSSKDV